MNPNYEHSDIEDERKYKFCEYCGTPIPKHSDESFCEYCRDRLLFQEVKEYIRSNDVNEFQVAKHFNIPLRTVKSWIKEGRIEYKELENGQRSINNRFSCERCGSPVTFGVLCPKCLKVLNSNTYGYNVKSEQDDDRMFFLNNDSKK